MKPKNLKTKIFLDSGDPKETKEMLKILGFLDGQTTNPTLIAKNPIAKKRLEAGKKFSKKEIYDFYRKVVAEISNLIPKGSVSVEVYADKNTTAKKMLKEAYEMSGWIKNAHIKLPITKEGLKATEIAIKHKMRVNLTLCFNQEQATAVYTATNGAKKGDVFVSPFIGRLDDQGENGMNLVENIIKMYKQGNNHVEVLAASVRTLDHFLAALKIQSDIITAPFKVLKEWAEKNLPTDRQEMILPEDFSYNPNLRSIPYQKINLSKNWQEYNITHELTEKGIDKFCKDWNELIK